MEENTTRNGSRFRRPLYIGAAVLCVLIVATVGVLLLRKKAPQTAPAALTSAETTLPATMATQPTTTIPTTAQTTAKPKPTLTFSMPTSQKFTTTASSVAMLGTADTAYPLTVNGKTVPLAGDGSFSVDQKLQPGKNQFVFKNGSKTVTYTVTFKVTVLKSVSPEKAVSLEGGGTVEFRAVARKGSKVKITMNGQTKGMSVVNAQDTEDRTVADADFDTYRVTFTMPAGKEGVQQKLGCATVSAIFNGLTETKKTAAVTLLAKPKTVQRVEITRGYAETFSGKTVNDFSRPVNAYLIAGTTDVIVQSGSTGGKNYYLLGCGRWVYTSDVKKISGGAVPANTVSAARVAVSDDATVLNFPMSWRVPHTVRLLPQTYTAAAATPPNYGLSGIGQTATCLEIGFAYTKKLPVAPNLLGSPLFSRAEWRQDTDGNAVLRLYLKEKGQFYGYSVSWQNNTLRFSCRHPNSAAGASAAKPLTGIRIVVDPGHGGRSSGTYGTIKGLYEKTVNLTYSLTLRDKLQALGATVIMTRTTDILPDNPTMDVRTDYARGGNVDLLLSVHMNGSASASANGCTLHYFNEYSYPVASLLSNSMRAVEKRHGIGNRAAVTVWSPFFMARVHDCPAVLLECGFMTNAANMQLLNQESYRNEMTDAMCSAVTQYFRSLPKYAHIAAPTTTTAPTAVTTVPTTTTAATTAPTDAE